MKKILPIILTLLALSLTACGGNPKKGSDRNGSYATDGSSEVLYDENGVEIIGANQTEKIGSGSVGDYQDGLRNVGPSALGKAFVPIVYFEYDQSEVDEHSLRTIKHYSRILVDNQDEKITLVGHTDERASPEYNLALGERRAKAVKESFMLYGVKEIRIEVITLGEEMPVVDEPNEKAWAENRRVEIIIK